MQVSTLIYAMEEEAEDILDSSGLNEEDRKNYDTVKASFKRHFVKSHNWKHERPCFNQCKQQRGE